MRQALFTIAPDAPFLPTLAARIHDGTLLGGWPRGGPFWLSDVTILLPTRRSRLALAEEFLKLGHALLPDIRAIGGEEPEEEPFLPPLDAPVPPPAAGTMERRLVLARLIEFWARQTDGTGGFANPPNAAEIFWLADSLAALVDDLAIEQVDAAALRAIAPENLAENWQQTLRFLDIALTAWPSILAGQGKADIVALRNERLAREAATLALRHGDRPVIAAGSTGSQPATAALLRAIAALPRGAVVLPGLDTDLPLETVKALADPQRASHAHPQYGLIKLLDRFGLRPDAVAELAPEPRPARTLLVRRALALAEDTAGWAAAREGLAAEFPAALDGITVMAAANEDAEARAIAIAARAALEQGRRIGIVSPDRLLARRIAAELQRFDIEVDDSAGTPLFQSPAGRFARLVLDAAASRFAPVPLMALLRHRAASFGRPRAEIARLADLVELGLLRGQRPAAGLDGLREALADNVAGRAGHPVRRLSEAEGAETAALFETMAAAFDPLCRLLAAPVVDAAQLAGALRHAVRQVAAAAETDAAAPLPGFEQFAAWADELAEGGEPGPGFPPIGLDAVLAALMAGREVRAARPARSDIAIWGRLEARLQQPDLTILAGLNEDVWPEPADPGPWLSRGMRLAAGLEPPERRQGQAAHDFEMAVGGPEVILAFALRRGTSPALASPLLQRLEAFIGGDWAKALRLKGERWLHLAQRLDAAAELAPATRPMPRPPAHLRPRRLSVTEIETLFRSPYDIYARHVLRLKPLDSLGAAPDARDRGTIVHDIFARFVNEGRDPADPDAPARLAALAEEAFAGLEAIGELRDIWLRRFRRTAELFLAYERGRAGEVVARHAERRGEWELPLLDCFRLTGRADRIDLLADGSAEIIDFKTGSPPASGRMKALEAPQLLLEAAIVRQGGFEGLPPVAASRLTYIKVGLGPEAFQPKPFALPDGMSMGEAVDAMSRQMQGHIAEFLLSDRHPMHARLLPLATNWPGPYDHLARTGEWLLAAGGEE
ncbi:MAG TPA: double-strand break repair protein AddB [Devosia sp.]|nr:double-strand break repair protein AddB [Devosia sp.]